ncbi:MAG: hypothetical protein CMM10_18740 [Rhodospirillaceae bacterium]|nr:hypothetical protein [Rhodospirillaceae bacterium]
MTIAGSTVADLVLVGGRVLKMDPALAVAEAVAIVGERITAVGGNDEIRAHSGPDTQVIDLDGRTAIPGLIDGHAHMDREGLKSVFPSLAGATSIDEVLERIESLVAERQPGDWVVTMPLGESPDYWDVPNNLTEKRFPTRWELDQVSPENPVYIRPIWGYWRHTRPIVSVANSLALECAGVGRNTAPVSKQIEFQKDPNSGDVNGIILEHTSTSIAELCHFSMIPRFTHGQRAAGIRESMRIYSATGTTGVFEGHGAAAELIRAYQEVHHAGEMIVRTRLVGSPAWSRFEAEQTAPILASWAAWLGGQGQGDDWLRVEGLHGGFGIEADDRLRAGAAPYTGWAGFNHDSGVPRERIKDYLIEVARNGIRFTTIGLDLLDILSQVNDVVPISDKRWVIAHPRRIKPAEIDLIAKLGLVVTVHTSHLIYNITAEEIAAGDENEIVPIKSLIDAGVHVALSTDNMPTSMFNPLWQSVARPNRYTGNTISPEQRISREAALKSSTVEGAYLTYEENIRGSIEVGKLADIAVLSMGPLSCPEGRLREITADLTIAGGKIVHQSRRR